MIPQPSGTSKFRIGGWGPGEKEATFLERYKPIFQDYLTDVVGSLYSPPISFEFITTDWSSDETKTSHVMIEEGTIDFTFTDRGYLVCIEDHLKVSSIVTLKDKILGKPSSAIGSVIYSLKSNNKIKNISDFKDKRLGVGHLFSSGSFHLGAEFLIRHGIHLYRDPSQVIFYEGDYVRQMEDIQRRNIDVAIVTSGFLEEHYPDLLDTFRFHHVMTPTFQGEVYPFLTSTDVIPGYGLAAVARVPNRLREQIYVALAALNDTHPLCINAGIAGFVAPTSYELPRTVARKAGVMIPTVEPDPLGHKRFDCNAPWNGYYEAISCPDGYLRDSEESVELNCERFHLFCPPDLHCVCRPCIPDMELKMYPVQVVMGLCVCLFVSALSIVLFWRIPTEAAHLLAGARHRPTKQQLFLFAGGGSSSKGAKHMA